MNDAAIAELPARVDGKTAQEHFAELRHWVIEHCNAGHAVRQACYSMSLSAIVHRLIKYGPDETINNLTSRDLLNLLIFTNGDIAEWLMRTAFTRALIEDDSEIFEHLANLPFMPECTAWYWKIVEGLVGAAPDPEAMAAWLEALPPEEKSLARLLVARTYPDTAHMDWLHDVPDSCPRIAYLLAAIIAQKELYRNALDNWMRDHPLVRNQAFT